MDIKTELQNFIYERLKVIASSIFIKRALAVIEGASNEKESLSDAADRVCKMISLFIDKDLGKEIYGNLKAKIDKGFS